MRCPFTKCTQNAGHGGDFHVGAPVEPDNPNRRHLYPKAEANLRILQTLGPGPYVGVSSDGPEDPDAIYRKRAGLDDLMRELE